MFGELCYPGFREFELLLEKHEQWSSTLLTSGLH